MRSLGQGVSQFKRGLSDMEDEVRGMADMSSGQRAEGSGTFGAKAGRGPEPAPPKQPPRLRGPDRAEEPSDFGGEKGVEKNAELPSDHDVEPDVSSQDTGAGEARGKVETETKGDAATGGDAGELAG